MKMAGAPLLTIVVATYNRPDTLRVAISMAQAQTFTDWQMLVIGDACAIETGETLASIGDRRIRYINLPARSGEQSGPNSVGMELADTPYLSFLNHDDIWTPDHLELAVASFDGDTEFYCSRAAFCIETDDATRPWEFTECSPPERTLGDVFHRPFYLFEPVSSWTFRTDAAKRVGAWRAATEIHRKPIENWLLRAWRENLHLTAGKTITVLKPKYLGRGEGVQYSQDSSGLLDLAKLARGDLSILRQRIADDIIEAIHTGRSRPFWYDFGALPPDLKEREKTKTPENAAIYKATGLDAFEEHCITQDLRTGDDLRCALKGRTGEDLMERPPLEDLISYACNELSRMKG